MVISYTDGKTKTKLIERQDRFMSMSLLGDGLAYEFVQTNDEQLLEIDALLA